MPESKPKLPNPNAVKELRERYQNLKNKRKAPKDLIDLFRKEKSDKKTAKDNPDLPDVEL